MFGGCLGWLVWLLGVFWLLGVVWCICLLCRCSWLGWWSGLVCFFCGRLGCRWNRSCLLLLWWLVGSWVVLGFCLVGCGRMVGSVLVRVRLVVKVGYWVIVNSWVGLGWLGCWFWWCWFWRCFVLLLCWCWCCSCLWSRLCWLSIGWLGLRLVWVVGGRKLGLVGVWRWFIGMLWMKWRMWSFLSFVVVLGYVGFFRLLCCRILLELVWIVLLVGLNW